MYKTAKELLRSIKLSSTNMSKLRQKFVEDVIIGAAIARKSSLENNIDLKDYTKENLIRIGGGTEHIIYDYGEYVLKKSRGMRISITKSNRITKDNVYEECSFSSIEELVSDSIKYLKQLNSYWYQEPLYLAGYYKHRNKYIPVYKQKKLKYDVECVLNKTSDAKITFQISYMTSKKLTEDNILNNNIFKENDLELPLDCNLNNFMFDENYILHAVDIK